MFGSVSLRLDLKTKHENAGNITDFATKSKCLDCLDGDGKQKMSFLSKQSKHGGLESKNVMYIGFSRLDLKTKREEAKPNITTMRASPLLPTLSSLEGPRWQVFPACDQVAGPIRLRAKPRENESSPQGRLEIRWRPIAYPPCASATCGSPCCRWFSRARRESWPRWSLRSFVSSSSLSVCVFAVVCIVGLFGDSMQVSAVANTHRREK